MKIPPYRPTERRVFRRLEPGEKMAIDEANERIQAAIKNSLGDKVLLDPLNYGEIHPRVLSSFKAALTSYQVPFLRIEFNFPTRHLRVVLDPDLVIPVIELPPLG